MFVNDRRRTGPSRRRCVTRHRKIERWDIADRDRPLDEATLDDRVLAIHVLRAVDGTDDLS
jgi:hypothetical protein